MLFLPSSRLEQNKVHNKTRKNKDKMKKEEPIKSEIKSSPMFIMFCCLFVWTLFGLLFGSGTFFIRTRYPLSSDLILV
jgi:hypothetical protein